MSNDESMQQMINTISHHRVKLANLEDLCHVNDKSITLLTRNAESVALLIEDINKRLGIMLDDINKRLRIIEDENLKREGGRIWLRTVLNLWPFWVPLLFLAIHLGLFDMAMNKLGFPMPPSNIQTQGK